jgi:hypothetical protein
MLFWNTQKQQIREVVKMNEIKLKVNFGKRTIVKSGISLTTGDYNSTKIIFEFDREDGTKIFEMKNPDGDIIFVDEIINNEVILVGQADVTIKHNDVTYIKYIDNEDTIYWYDKEAEKIYDTSFVEVQNVSLDNLTKITENASLFTMPGRYTFEISLYDGDSKLTSKSDYLDIKEEQVVINDNMVSLYLPVFDRLMSEIETLDIDVSKQGTTTTVELTKKDGTTTTVEILDGEKGEKGDTPVKGVDYFTPQDIEDLNIPKKTSDLTNDSDYITSQDILGKQNIEDNTLNTNNKTVPSAINEVNSLAKGANQAIAFPDYYNIVTAFNLIDEDYFRVGQNVYVIALNVPDLWISKIETTSAPYTYTTDEAFINDLTTNGYVQVGYYRLSALETQKVDLTNYVTFTNYPSGATAGVIKTLNTYATAVDGNGRLMSQSKGYTDYNNGSSSMFISKGTLENVITGKGLVSNTDYASGSSAGVVKTSNVYGISTDNGTLKTAIKSYSDYSSASSYLFISKGTLENVLNNVIGNIDSVLDAINGEVI